MTPFSWGKPAILLTHPLHPTAFELVWNQERSQHASAFLPGGPRAAVRGPHRGCRRPECLARAYWIVWLLAGLWATGALAIRATRRDGWTMWP